MQGAFEFRSVRNLCGLRKVSNRGVRRQAKAGQDMQDVICKVVADFLISYFLLIPIVEFVGRWKLRGFLYDGRLF